MPCRVDLFEGYKYYDHYDLADHMYFNTPLVPLMCEVMEIIKNNGLLGTCSNIAQQWYVYHKMDDHSRELEGKRIIYRDHEKLLASFIEHMREVGFSANSGILTETEKEEIKRKREESNIELEKYRKESEIKAEEQRQKEQKRKDAMNDAIRQHAGKELSYEERNERVMHDVCNKNGNRITEIFLDNVSILKYID